MLETRLPVSNVHWSTDRFSIWRPGTDDPEAGNGITRQNGRYAAATHTGNVVVLTRDRLGLNKLYFAIDRHRGVVAANFLADLVASGIPFDAIYAVPAGARAIVDLNARTIRLDRHHRLPPVGTATDPRHQLAQARERLIRHIEVAAAAVPAGATVAVCLSGGLDSGLIAALLRDHVTNLWAYTYAFDDRTGQLSPDAVAAEQLARRLGIPFRFVTADADRILAALPHAYRNGQDWRDFNVHCAVVNEILAEAIAADLAAEATESVAIKSFATEPVAANTATAGQETLVFTGDLMNELVGDYTPIRYRGQDYYPLPAIAPDDVRTSLLRGLQCGDREVGVFAAHGLTAVQPYAHISDDLLQVPSAIAKPDVIRSLAGTLLPADAYDRPKARAQIGSPTATTGILPLMVDAGIVGERLEHEFCAAIGLTAPHPLRGRIRAGVYRFPSHFPLEAT